jgi:Ca2+-binding RTX toxin-like protein
MPTYTGTNGDDSYWGGPDADLIEGLGGQDYLLGNGGDDEILGGDGDDNLHGGDGNDILDGGEGNDLLQGDDGVDTLRGMAGNDRLLVTNLPVAGELFDGGDGLDTLQFDAGGSAPIIFSIFDPAVVQNIYGAAVVNIEQLSFRAGSGNDTVTGGALNDYIDGYDGNDRIDGGLGDDSLDGGLGTDTVYGGGGNDTIRGGGGLNDVLYGDDGDDTFHWNSTDALIDGGAGIDQIRMEYYVAGIDLTVNLSNPNFETMAIGTRVIGVERLWIQGGDGNDRFTGGAWDDVLVGNKGNDILTGGAGNDTLSGGDGNDQLFGGAGDDFLHCYPIFDLNPNDLVDGGDGFDTLEFWAHNATAPITIDILSTTAAIRNVEKISFRGGSGINHVSSGDSTDILFGGVSGDYFDGRGGDDDIRAGDGDNTLIGGSGNDFLEAGAGADVLSGGDGDDILQSGGGNDNLNGGAGNDELSGSDGNDQLWGDFGDDILIGGAGSDSLFGEAGFDIVSYRDASAGVTVNLATGIAQSTAPGDAAGIGIDTIVDVEIAWGSAFADHMIAGTSPSSRLIGWGGDDTLIGGVAFDELIGGDGNDVITGGIGSDRLFGDNGFGNTGNDTFRDTTSGLNTDTIADFGVGDKILFTDATLGAFTFSLTGSTLSYTGGSLTLTGVTGTLVANAAAGGGVQLTLQAIVNDVRNDFNGDGRSDVLWRHDNGSFTTWLANASGGFVSNDANSWNGVPTEWRVVGTGDFNGDGRDDVVWRRTDGAFTEWLAQGNGSFTSNDAHGWTVLPNSWQVDGVGVLGQPAGAVVGLAVEIA